VIASWAGKPVNVLLVAIAAWAALSVEVTIGKMEVTMDAHVTIDVQGEAGARVALGLGKTPIRASDGA
jgi:hypothetical protein